MTNSERKAKSSTSLRSTNLSNVLKKALKLVKPDKSFEKALLDKCNRFVEKLSKTAKVLGLDIEFNIGGSVAKGTFLKQLQDVDVFAAFSIDKGISDLAISDSLESVLKASKLGYERVHGSRDYFIVRSNGLNFEVVPVLKIKSWEQALNMTDVSLLHVSWVKSKLKSNPKLADEIRLAKQFCKTIKCYGAESFVKGFSGHLLDILVIHYNGFLELLKNSVKWIPFETVIDPANNYKHYLKVKHKMAVTPLTVVEPVHAQRNAAAALSIEKFERFRQKASQLLKHPSIDFFVIKPLNINTFLKESDVLKRNKNIKVLELRVKALSGNADVSGAKALKIYNYVNKQLINHDFNVIDSNWEFFKQKLEAIMLYALPLEDLPEEYIVRGPPIKAIKHVDRFKQKHSNVFQKQNRFYAVVKRKFRKPEQLVNMLITQEYITSRCSGASLRVHNPKNISLI